MGIITIKAYCFLIHTITLTLSIKQLKKKRLQALCLIKKKQVLLKNKVNREYGNICVVYIRLLFSIRKVII